MGGNVPGPSSAEKALQTSQAQALDQQRAQIQAQIDRENLLLPIVYGMAGLRKTFDAQGNQIGYEPDPDLTAYQNASRAAGLSQMQAQAQLAQMQVPLLNEQIDFQRQLEPFVLSQAEQQRALQTGLTPLQLQSARNALDLQTGLTPLQLQSAQMGLQGQQLNLDYARQAQPLALQAQQAQLQLAQQLAPIELQYAQAQLPMQQQALTQALDQARQQQALEQRYYDLTLANAPQQNAAKLALLQRLDTAMKGGLANPALEAQIARSGELFEGTMRNNLGPGYQTSQAYIVAKKSFEDQVAQLRDTSNRNDIAQITQSPAFALPGAPAQGGTPSYSGGGIPNASAALQAVTAPGVTGNVPMTGGPTIGGGGAMGVPGYTGLPSLSGGAPMNPYGAFQTALGFGGGAAGALGNLAGGYGSALSPFYAQQQQANAIGAGQQNQFMSSLMGVGQSGLGAIGSYYGLKALAGLGPAAATPSLLPTAGLSAIGSGAEIGAAAGLGAGAAGAGAGLFGLGAGGAEAAAALIPLMFI